MPLQYFIGSVVLNFIVVYFVRVDVEHLRFVSKIEKIFCLGLLYTLPGLRGPVRRFLMTFS